MIAKLFKPKSRSALMRYVTRDGRDGPITHQIIAGNMLGTEAQALINEFKVSSNLRPDVRKPVVHISLSIRPGLSLNPDQWASACACFLQEMGFKPLSEYQFVAIRHLDRPHDHVHIIASRVSILSAKLVREVKGDYLQAHRAAAVAAGVVGLTPVLAGSRKSSKKMGGNSFLPHR